MNQSLNGDGREFDLVVYGASGFTGRLVVEYLLRQYAGGALKWAVAGRSRNKLEAVLSELGTNAATVPVLIADSSDADALGAIAERTRTVLTTVGPYAKYGSDLVAACVEHGTHYCDLAGEVQWMREMIDTHQERAVATGARIVHACGFDSVPSDLGTWFLQRKAILRFGAPCQKVSLLVRAMRGGASGGTVASLLDVIEESRRDRDVARLLSDPYTLNPKGQREGPDGRDQSGVAYNKILGVWTSPFVMALVNQRVVRRTNALTDYAYGRDFQYSEAVISGPGVSGRLKAVSQAAGLGAFMLASSNDWARENVVKRFMPEPGEGPDEERRESGFFNLVLVGRTANRDVLKARVTGDRDPGYGSTSKMISECAVCLATDELDLGGGFWTPASAMGDVLLDRLVDNAGLTFELI